MSDLSPLDLAQIRNIVREELEDAMRPPILLIPDPLQGWEGDDEDEFVQELVKTTRAVIIRGPSELLDQIDGFGPTKITRVESVDDLRGETK